MLCLADCPSHWMPWLHIFPRAFCCNSSNPPAHASASLDFPGMGYSTLCFWHLLPPLSSCDPITLSISFLCPSHAGFACVNVHFDAGLGNTSSQMLSAAVQGIQPGWHCSTTCSGDKSIYHLILTSGLPNQSLWHKTWFPVFLLPILYLTVRGWVPMSLNDMATQCLHGLLRWWM